MSINSKCTANPKHANIKKSSVGESADYISLKTIKNADVSTPEGLKIRNNAIIELKDRYKAAIEGSKRKLVEMCSGHYTVLSNDVIENYEYDCYEHFMMAVNGMDLNRIQHMKGTRITARLSISTVAEPLRKSLLMSIVRQRSLMKRPLPSRLTTDLPSL